MNLPHYPATLRNRDPIATVIREHLPLYGQVLETASGTGEHIVYFAQKFPSLIWHPSDREDAFFGAIQKRSHTFNNIVQPKQIDVLEENKNIQEKYDALFNINMIHISRWETCTGLFSLAQKILLPHGFVYMYGPYKRNGQHTASSNATFDANLRAQNVLWGVRDMEDVISVAEQHDFSIRKIIPMPANNFSLLFYRNETDL